VSVGSEGDAWWARTDALDITAEGDTLFGALVALREHVEEWLEYLEEVNPQLSEELEQQRSTAARLREPGSHWLGQIVFEFPA
jgi:hypothetical protein